MNQLLNAIRERGNQVLKKNLKESMLRTSGARGMFINNEFAKNVMRRRASKFIGTSIADSLIVINKWSLTTWYKNFILEDRINK